MSLSISPLKHCRVHILILTFFCTLSVQGFAQWVKLADFDKPVVCIYFPEQTGKPLIGFLSTGTASDTLCDLYKTVDGGISWRRINQDFGEITSIVFKDISTGWLISHTINPGCYSTTDGGESWNLSTIGNRSPVQIYYEKNSNLLYISHWGVPTLASNDLGNSWNNISISKKNAVIFSTKDIGISTYFQGSNLSITNDGGINWTDLPIRGECWQPACLLNSNVYICPSDGANDILVTRDGGNNWNSIIPYPDITLTGSSNSNDCGQFFIQSSFSDNYGILVSNDSGSSWTSISGPRSRADTRFYVKNNVIYAAQYVDLPFTDLDKGELWLYTLQLKNSFPIAIESTIYATQCDPFDTIITVVTEQSCYSDSISITSVSQSGSTEFSVSSPTLFPLKLTGYDSLGIRYTPVDSGDDTTYLTINFYRDGDRFDTIITLIGHADIGKGNILSSFNPDTVYSNTVSCSKDSEVIRFRVQDTCRNLFAIATKGNISGSSAFLLPPQLPKQSTGDDSLVVTFFPFRFGLDTSMLHVTFELDGVNVDTTFVLIGEYRPSKLSLAPSVSDTSLSVTSSNCIAASGRVYYWVFDSCLGVKGELVSATVTGSTNFLVTADADSATVIYSGAGSDTAKLVLKFRLYEYEYDTVITLYGYPSATKDSLSFHATLTKPSVTVEEPTELPVAPDKAAATKNLPDIRFSLTPDPG